jgi:2-keto-3-deoxy-L-rhamnonate aldolase RhmA
MIEKTTAVDDLDEILDVPELGFIFIGPSDLSVQMGHPTDKHHPEVESQIEDACLDAGVPLGGIRTRSGAINEAVERRYQLLRVGGDLDAIKTTIGDRLDEIHEDD